MTVKTQRPRGQVPKKASHTIIQKKTSNGQVPIKFLLQHLNYPISIYDFRKRKFIYVNQQFTQVTGLEAEECYNMGINEFLASVESTDLLALQGEIKNRLEKAIQQFIIGT